MHTLVMLRRRITEDLSLLVLGLDSTGLKLLEVGPLGLDPLVLGPLGLRLIELVMDLSSCHDRNNDLVWLVAHVAHLAGLELLEVGPLGLGPLDSLTP